MVKKRLVFTLLHDGEDFVLSRNFRLQKVGNLEWLRKNYRFENTARSIDELIILNVNRDPTSISTFAEVLKAVTHGCFVPVSAGGGVRSTEDAALLLRSGADKIVLNTILHTDMDTVKNISLKFGQQCIVASVDVLTSGNGDFRSYYQNGVTPSVKTVIELLVDLQNGPIGELYLNAIHRDGTGQGYDINLLDLLPKGFNKPVILAGGVGNSEHFHKGLMDGRVDAVATAHLFNFVGDGLARARENLKKNGHVFPQWDYAQGIDSKRQGG